MRLLLDNLPQSLEGQRESLRKCLEAMNQVMPLEAVYLFGSHARGDARQDSDVDLCLVSEGAGEQLKASQKLSEAIWDVWPRPAFTLIPISPERLEEKRRFKDHFFQTVLSEGKLLAAKN